MGLQIHRWGNDLLEILSDYTLLMNSAEMPVPLAQKNNPAHPVFNLFKPGVSFCGAALLFMMSLAAPGLYSQTPAYTFSTLAGIGGRQGSINGSGGGIGFPLFNAPSGVVVNKSGNLYITDSGNELIREVTPAGTVTTLAGAVGLNGITDGTGIGASFNSPQGPAIDASGNLYVAEFSSSTIRKITPAGVVITVAGLALSSGNSDGTGSAARFFKPSGVAVDGSGNIFVADSGNNTIRKISAGVVTTFAGTAGVTGSLDGTGTAASFNYPRSVVIDSAGNLFVADTNNNAIRKITSAGVVTTLAGKAATFGSADGVGPAARFNFPNGLALDGSGNIYVADELNHLIRQVTPSGTVTTLAGAAGTAGKVDGTGSAARFNNPTGVSVDGSGNLYVADYNNELIRKITPAGVVTTIAGVATISGALDGIGYNLTPAEFSNPSSTAVDTLGNVYVADTGNSIIRRISAAGVVTTLAGSPTTPGRVDGAGTAASFTTPGGVATDAAGNVYVADAANHLIRFITPAGVVSTLAGTGGTAGSADGAGTTASFNFPTAVAVDGAGNVYVADYNNDAIRKISPAGIVSTLAGSPGVVGSADGVGGAARFNHPRGVAVDSGGNVYVADFGNQTIRKISPGGLVLTLAGSSGVSGTSDGAGSIARFNGPSGVAVDGAGNVYVSDTNNSTIRQVTLAGVVTTIGGLAGSASNVDGVGSAARFDHSAGLATDALGNLYIADTRNHTIRKGVTATSGGGPGGPAAGGSNTGGTGGASGSGGTGGNGGTGGGGAPSGTGSGFVMRPGGLTQAVANTFYVADTANNCIKSIAGDGTITVFAGKEGSAGSADGTGSAALFNGPTGLRADSAGTIYVCDTGNATVRKITSAGVVTTIAGSPGSRGTQDGTGSAALFSSPSGIALDSTGNLFVSDSANCTIRKITSAGVVTTFAGTAKSTGDADGLGTAARFNNPTGLAITLGNILFVADTFNDTIRKINTTDVTVLGADGVTVVSTTPAGTVTTFAGSAGISGAFDGTGTYALFNLPYGLGLDSGSNVFVADTGNNCIRRISSTGAVTTLAGIAGIAGNRDGTFTTALFNQPQALLISSFIIVADTGNSVLRTINTDSIVSTLKLKLATSTTPATTTPASTSSGYGGGGMDPWFVGALLSLSGFALRTRRNWRSTKG